MRNRDRQACQGSDPVQFGLGRVQVLVAEGLSVVRGIKPADDKIMRLHAQTATIENGFVHLPTSAPWLADFLHELTVFPNGRHDDQVDSTAQAIAWTKQWSSTTGMLDYYRELLKSKPSSRSEPFACLRRRESGASMFLSAISMCRPIASWNCLPKMRGR